MESELRVMEDLKNQIERNRINFKKSPKERITLAYVTIRLEALEKLINAFTIKHENIVKNYDEEDLEETPYVKNELFENGYETYLDYKTELQTALNKINFEQNCSKNVTPSTSSSKDSVAKLPKISLPTFSGKYSEWISFRDLFTSLVHNNPVLEDVQRLHYLKTQVLGEAEQLIRYIPITQANYVKCWDILSNRYNNKRFMSNCILKTLFNQRSCNSESSDALKELLDTTTDCLHELSNLGIDVSTWDVIVIYIISLKLDADTRKQWELHVSQSCEDLPSFLNFKKFLENRFHALEILEPTKPKPKSTSGVGGPRVLHAMSGVSCSYCSEEHRLHACKSFSKEDVDRRREIVQALGLCFNCFGNNHISKLCRSSTKCHICQRKHHSLLHPQGPAKPASMENVTSESQVYANETTSDIKTHFLTGKVHNQTLLATALIKAESKNGNCQVLRALLDQGSQASFISEAAVQLLNLKKICAKTTISGLGGGHGGLISKYVVMINIQSIYDQNYKIQVKAHVLSNVTSILPGRKFSMNDWSDIQYISLADPQCNIPSKIDVLLGAEVYCNIIKKGLIKSPTGLIIAQDTYLGWILSGQIKSGTGERSNNVVLNALVHEEFDMLKRFWELESEPSTHQQRILTPEEQACEDHFSNTTCRDETGRYIVELPFRSSNLQGKYGNTRILALKRLWSLEKRLGSDLTLKKEYSQVVNEYLSLDHMERIQNENDIDELNCVWLPHHAVIRLDKTTSKTRVVFDASSKGSNGVSLNDTLMVGPTLQPDLRHIVLRWRVYPICLTADIIKMYRQVKVATKHVDFQRIVWRDDKTSNVSDYRLLRVTFGTSCAPYLAVKALQQVAEDEGHAYPAVAKRVKTDFYMDDLMTGCQSEIEAVNIYHQMNELLKKGGFTLQKWSSNREGLLERLVCNTGKDLDIKVDKLTKILGLTWNRRSDEFDYTVQLSSSATPETKRKIIAEISRLYDPLGWIAPCILTAKVFIQKLWITGLGWDDAVPLELLQEWENYRQELAKLVNFHIPRWYHGKEDDTIVEIHGFCDASNVAYAAVIYIRIIDAEGRTHTNLVTAKTKVAPIKQISVPRLELCGAVLVTKLLMEVSEVLQISKDNIHAWTDSTVVLAWLCDHPSRWKTFVANRTTEIVNALDATHWSYVQSKDNPADCASRGITPSALLNNQLWKEGPIWLRNSVLNYTKPNSICTKTDVEAKTINTYTVKHSYGDWWSKFSSLRKLVRVIAYCRRFLTLKLHVFGKTRYLPYLSAAEIQDSLTCCIRQSQVLSFAKEIESLAINHQIDKRSRLISLSPFLDNARLLRVGGRIHNCHLSEGRKHPIIIPSECQLAKLIVADAHEKTMHGGQQLMIHFIRTKYWIIGLKGLVKSHTHHCITCIRYASEVQTQLMGRLPSCRVTPSKPFLHAGVDYAGPINMRLSKGRGQRAYKGYICLFVCMATRAVHIEAVSDLTSEGFLAAFRRFVARRGRCIELWSDNGTNFVGAAKQLNVLFGKERASILDEIAGSLANNGTYWKFIPPHAPNFGGIWEAGIKSTKHHLKRVIGDSTLTYEEITTVLSQIEACLNSRPLSKSSSDPKDGEPLTPGHFLIGEPLITAPDYNYEHIHLGTLRRWQLTQRMVQNFWSRWSQEYLTQFFQRYKWNIKTPEPKIGDVVLVKEPNMPPAKWLYGVVDKVHPGSDNLIRVVTLRCKNSLIMRPTSKLCILPVNDH